ncbi:hypothetical protein Scep_012805 [Stephania cephalantha]|uniref:Uncharacterized protein n=1 Tax=Stephania cephalantha TaxID=152367 RepID=A0AAP0JI24_9MAGN
MNTKVGRTNNNLDFSNKPRKLLNIFLPPAEQQAHSFSLNTLQVNESTHENKKFN